MHTHFPHPANRIVVLRVNLPLDTVDREVIPRLIEERADECGPVHLLLEINGLSSAENCALIVESLLPAAKGRYIKKIALVLLEEDMPRAEPLKSQWADIEHRCFSTVQRGEGLAWTEI